MFALFREPNSTNAVRRGSRNIVQARKYHTTGNYPLRTKDGISKFLEFLSRFELKTFSQERFGPKIGPGTEGKTGSACALASLAFLSIRFDCHVDMLGVVDWYASGHV